MKKYATLAAASLLILACNAVSNALPSNSSAPEAATSPDTTTFSFEEAPTPSPVDANSLVGRHPSEWLPDHEIFAALNDIPFQGSESYVNEDLAGLLRNPETEKEAWQKELDFQNQNGRIVNLTYLWYIPECNTESESPSAQMVTTIYKDAAGAQAGLESYSNLYDTPTNPKQEVEVGDIGYSAFYRTPTCDASAWTAWVYFRRNNIFGIVGVTTFKLSANFEKIGMATGLAKQLDRIILNEMAYHPGTPDDLAALQQSAKTVDLSSSAEQNPPPGTGDPADFITPLLSCGGSSGLDGTYNLYGTVKNTSESPIWLTIDWGASDDAVTIPYNEAWGTRTTKTVKVAQNYTRTVDLQGGAVILDNIGYPYTECKIYSIKASWVE